MKLEIVNSGTETFPYYVIMEGDIELCACDSLEKAKRIVKNCNIADVSHCFLTPSKAREMADTAMLEYISSNHDVERFLQEIEDKASQGEYKLEAQLDDYTTEKLRKLGYKVSEPYEAWGGEWVVISW